MVVTCLLLAWGGERGGVVHSKCNHIDFVYNLPDKVERCSNETKFRILLYKNRRLNSLQY